MPSSETTAIGASQVIKVADATTWQDAGADQSQSCPRAGGAVRAPSTLKCAVLLIALKAALRLYGFARTLGWIRDHVVDVPAVVEVDLDAVRAVEWKVAMTAAFYPGRARCLEQSLVLYYLLRRKGVAVQYRQGVLPYPFQAHAWVEYMGEVINDVPEHARQFVLMPDQLP